MSLETTLHATNVLLQQLLDAINRQQLAAEPPKPAAAPPKLEVVKPAAPAAPAASDLIPRATQLRNAGLFPDLNTWLAGHGVGKVSELGEEGRIALAALIEERLASQAKAS